jgi:hypothetical protein
MLAQDPQFQNINWYSRILDMECRPGQELQRKMLRMRDISDAPGINGLVANTVFPSQLQRVVSVRKNSKRSQASLATYETL